jgi:SAM-dependent methyltransferase
MNCFQIIKSVLDEAYNEIPGDEAGKDNDIKDAFEYLRTNYSQLWNQNKIDYSNSITRFAYIYVYVTSHANLVCSLIQQKEDLCKLFDNNKVDVACIGGGPGSDFLGILKYLITNQKSPDATFQLCDREATWAESWIDVHKKVDPKFRISTSYLPLDVTHPDSWKPFTKYFQSDIFTMIYFMSEVFALRESAEEYFATIFSKAKPGSFFLFIDNNAAQFYNWFDALAKTHNIKIIDSGERKEWLPYHEEKSDLGIYFQKFSSPKITANIAYRIGKKMS